MITKVYSATVVGIEAEIVEVEVDVLSGLPKVVIVGLPDTAVNEARERVRSAIKNSHGIFPPSRVAVNLAPADLPKVGTQFDLPIAISILLNSGQLVAEVADTLFVGELALDGAVRPVPGVLPVALSALNHGFKKLVVPSANAPEAALVRGLTVFPIKSLQEVIGHLQAIQLIDPHPSRDLQTLLADHQIGLDLKDIRGQEHAKRASEIAAAGGHNLLMVGSPGSGKTLLARSFATILPRLSEEEVLEVTKIYSVAGVLSSSGRLVTTRPFRAPHHTASTVSLVGGGSVPRPGEISLAHRGVLFLDELPEFNRSVLESLRQPLEDGSVTVARAQSTVSFPARFTLVAAQNPCPCGYYGDSLKNCTCSPGAVLRYRKKISGPLLDRIDLHVEVPRISYEKITQEQGLEDSATVRARVEQARIFQKRRFLAHQLNFQTNAEMGLAEIKQFCRLEPAGQELMRSALSSLHLSTRGYFRVLRVARTIADLSSSEKILSPHLAEAIQYRPKED